MKISSPHRITQQPYHFSTHNHTTIVHEESLSKVDIIWSSEPLAFLIKSVGMSSFILLKQFLNIILTSVSCTSFYNNTSLASALIRVPRLE